jgi:hypothetical protein
MGILCQTEVIDGLEQFPDQRIVVDHAVRVSAKGENRAWHRASGNVISRRPS